MPVSSQVIHPQALCIGSLRLRLFVEEQHVRLHSSRVPNAGRKSQQSMNVASFQKTPTNFLTRPSFEEHVVRYYHCCSSLFAEHGIHMLKKIELLIARRRPELFPFIVDRIRLLSALVAENGDTTFLSKRWIGEDHIHRRWSPSEAVSNLHKWAL